MSTIRTVMLEATFVVAVLATGLTAAEAARAAPVAATVQAAADPRADVKIESRVQVERVEQDAAGQPVKKLYAPADIKVIPGDLLVITNVFRNTGSRPVTGFVINNPVHPAVDFISVAEDWARVSVDGGKTFGKLTELTVISTDSAANEGENQTTVPSVSRAAQPADVTHVRWTFPEAIAAGESGELSFRGSVK
ncbi:hypothetical protein SAMN02745824_0902 [Parasphingorhabdus marina DSM 22363]|uniref:Uncharacterized protein n=1 Tax=Parasphingorhabdus marina DSM 22363 TaxID=1123272 RepID=A0A1N6CT03_9SPHN|nr:hypothetical protein [Parasphingorhabdus marina]SIN61524.1 hypothetical protein SAMN02745824_0902 [Parasphingorhabdus marina DSM 22363]